MPVSVDKRKLSMLSLSNVNVLIDDEDELADLFLPPLVRQSIDKAFTYAIKADAVNLCAMTLKSNVKQFRATTSSMRVLTSSGGAWVPHCSSNSSLQFHGFNYVFHPRQGVAGGGGDDAVLLRLRPGFVLTIVLNFDDSEQGNIVRFVEINKMKIHVLIAGLCVLCRL